jgi:hypothetical protein
MTILSKKKTIQGKSEVESSETTTHHNGSHSHGIALGSIPNHPQVCIGISAECYIFVIDFNNCTGHCTP